MPKTFVETKEFRRIKLFLFVRRDVAFIPKILAEGKNGPVLRSDHPEMSPSDRKVYQNSSVLSNYISTLWMPLLI